MNREKVVAEIEDALSGNLAKVGHVYRMSLNGLKDKALADALALLKEQEIKTGEWEPQPSNEEQGERPFIWWKCSECGQIIYSESERDRKEFNKYCGRCGSLMT